MALDYNLYSLASYDPYTYDDLMKPIQAYIDNYKELETAMTEYDTNLSAIESQINNELDPTARLQLLNYRDSLVKQRDLVSRYGFNSSTRLGLNNLKSDYARLVTPIQTALETRKEEIKELRELKLKDPTLRLSREASKSSLDDYLGGLNPDYEAVSGNDVLKKVSEMAKQFAKSELTEEETLALGDLYYKLKLISGLTYDLIMLNLYAANANNPRIANFIKLVSQITDNMFAENSAYDKKWAESYKQAGFLDAIGGISSSYQRNIDHLSPLDLVRKSREERLAKKEEQLEKMNLVTVNGKTIIGHEVDIEDAKKALGDDWNEAYRTKFTKIMNIPAGNGSTLYMVGIKPDGTPQYIYHTIIDSLGNKHYVLYATNANNTVINLQSHATTADLKLLKEEELKNYSENVESVWREGFGDRVTPNEIDITNRELTTSFLADRKLTDAILEAREKKEYRKDPENWAIIFDIANKEIKLVNTASKYYTPEKYHSANLTKVYETPGTILDNTYTFGKVKTDSTKVEVLNEDDIVVEKK